MAGVFSTSLYSIANAVWSVIAEGSRTVNTNQWRGGTPNALVSGRVDAVASVVSDKTGYSLTAGSYSPMRSVQRGVLTISGTTNSASISGVNTSKAFCALNGATSPMTTSAGSANCEALVYCRLTGSTTVEVGRGSAGGGNTNDVYWEIVEPY